jgi:hypothetical protein
MSNLTKYLIINYYLQSFVSKEFAGIDLTAWFVSTKRTLQGLNWSFYKDFWIYFLKNWSNVFGCLYYTSISTAALQAPYEYTITQLPLCLIL